MIRIRGSYQLPEEKQDKLRAATKLEWATIVYALATSALLYVVMGESQAMRAEALEHLFELVPPIAFLVAMHFRNRQPNERFPYGYRRVISVAYVLASMALLGLGLFILYEAVMSLINGEHPTIGVYALFGRQLWAGWVMIGVLFIAALFAVILGHLKMPYAKALHEKVLYADAEILRADWLSSGAAILGILGIGLGYWWADSVAATLIALEIVWDGFTNVKRAIGDLMDEIPTKVGTEEEEPFIDELKKAIEQCDWIKEAAVRLREEGDVFAGEVYVVPKYERNLLENVKETYDWLQSYDWRLYDIVIMPVPSLNPPDGPERERVLE